MKKKFEYKVLRQDLCSNNFDVEDYLNTAGSDGWELVGAVTTTNGKPILYLKREKVKVKKEKKTKVSKVGEGLLPIPPSLFPVEKRIREIIVDKLGVDDYEVTEDASLRDDLGMDSLDAVELIMEFEREFNIEIRDEDAEPVVKFGDAVNLIYNKLISKK
jgi:acyl carrier protein